MIIVSACLAGEKCRYDGRSCLDEEIRELVLKHQAIAVCPESLGGLSVPRTASEIVNGKVVSFEGEDRTKQFIAGAQKALEIALKNNCRFAVFKSKSPSCGLHRIYDGTFSGTLVEGNGITAQLFLENGIQVMDEHMFKSFQKPE